MRLLATFFVAFALQSAPAIEPGFVSLFNGKDFTGWKVANPASFKIENGAIVANGTPGHAYYDGPVGNHAFTNFILKVDVMTRANSNGGIFIGTEYQESGWPAKGLEVQVNNTYKADPIKSGSLYQIVNVNEPPAKDDEWFTETITVQGSMVMTQVNDKHLVHWMQPADWKGLGAGGADKRIRTGTIALQAHDPGSTVYYRNIRIQLSK
jgi:hypothetical protein